MKNLLQLLVLAIIVLLSSCSKDDENTFDYDINLLVGKWRITHVETDERDGNYINITEEPWLSVFEPTYATFNANGTYYGEGFFGDGSGTYSASGKTIITYIDGDEFLRYDVIALSGTDVELKMYEVKSKNSIKIKCKKQ